MAQRYSGDVFLDITYNPKKRLHHRSAPGVYRVLVGFVKAKKIIDGLTISIPKRHHEEPEAPEAIDEIAATALNFTLANRKLPVEVGEANLLVIETKHEEIEFEPYSPKSGRVSRVVVRQTATATAARKKKRTASMVSA